MIPGPDAQRAKAQLLVWWIIWGAILGGLVVLYAFLGRGQSLPGIAPPAQENPLAGLAGFVPLFLSIVIRWLVLPRYNNLKRAFPMFIVGLALAEACGIMGIFLGGPYREDLFLLGVLGIAQYVPFFAKGYLEPKSGGFFPKN